MASSYFSNLTSPDDSDVDAIISEAADLCVLEHISALNTAHLSAAGLPAELESRFRKLKTFPGENRRPKLPPHCSVQEKENIPQKSEEAKPEILSAGSPRSEPGEGIGLSSSPPAMKRSPSPTRVVCCFGCSPKKMVQRRKVKNGDEIFTALGSEKMKEQRRKLEKVLREQERASREVERMVEIMEEAAARLNAEAFDKIMGGDEAERFK